MIFILGMAFGEDWLGWTIFVFIIAAIITLVIKVLIEYPGLTGLKCVYNEDMEDSKHVDEYDDIRSKHRDNKKKMRYPMLLEQELLIGGTVSETCCDKDKVSKGLVTRKKEKTIPSKKENIETDTVKETKLDENPDEIIIDNEPVEIKKKVSFNMTCEKQAKIKDDKHGKIIAVSENSKHWSCLQFIPGRQDGRVSQSL
jgi:hypothetical protein